MKSLPGTNELTVVVEADFTRAKAQALIDEEFCADDLVGTVTRAGVLRVVGITTWQSMREIQENSARSRDGLHDSAHLLNSVSGGRPGRN